MSGFQVSTNEADAVLYTVLSVCTVLAFSAVFLAGKQSFEGSENASKKADDGPFFSMKSILSPTDEFLSARDSASATTIAVSFFASGMGAWVVYGTTEMGATPSLSWLGVLGYAGASAFPALLLAYLGPLVRARTDLQGDKGFSTTDFGLKRYGRLMQLAVAAISGFYMFIYLVAELTSIANVFALLVGKDTAAGHEGYTTRISISVAAFTLFYTAVAGLPASIFTDKFQGALVGALVLVLTIALCSEPSNQVTAKEFGKASQWTGDGFTAAVTLVIAICSAELFNQGSWQRVWAARTDEDLKRGMAGGCVLIFLVMMFFGIMGMVAYSNDPESYDTYAKLAYLSFFDLLEPMGAGWQVLTLVLLTTLCASSVDTLQNALASILSRDLIKYDLSINWSRAIVVAINVPAVIMAAQRYDVIPLFLIADLVCATSVFPVFLGLLVDDLVVGGVTIPAPTELGAFFGCCSGLAAVLVNGAVNGVTEATNPYTGEVYEEGPFAYFWLTNGYQCALCGSKTMVTFIVVPLASLVATLVFTKLDLLFRGDRARAPLFKTDIDLANQKAAEIAPAAKSPMAGP
mmetsp:Transcript_28017/g.62504  ORF Transcript_28017/g.62504 Transcript_28017/m.62504 type:complete len:576 (+) Transcript_28017:180-1907(+)|eukprot:CAMPEP_0172590554 /NCGR_PEP_ID=MMETSP1068-20121228/9093_1 /TAXON_ID=35684 /ORGANISM="Pseudopedinella elastica, Strain CCMP716" /LENGTH=575 /DNA_ID=CAMNT_0013386495 /DNA_START=107 /DNA_END=1834 /DNA_ORIENTATION=+